MFQIRYFRLLMYVLIIGFSLIIVSSFTSAQNDFDRVVILGQNATVRDLMWSADSQQLVFIDPNKITAPEENDVLEGIELTQPIWYQYDLTTGVLTSQTNWPLYPTLTSNELEGFKTEGFIFASPDGNLLVYAQNPPELEYGLRQLVIANRQTGQVAGISRYIGGVLLSPGIIFGDVIRWSKDGTGLTISYPNPVNEVLVIYMNIPDKNDLQTIQVYDFELTLDGRDYLTFVRTEDRICGISDDGDHVLLTGRQYPPPDQDFYTMPTELIVWTPSSPETSYVLDPFRGQKILDASFAPGNETKLLIVTDTSLIQYNLLTGQSTTLRSDFGSFRIIKALFSPDGNWLMIHIPGELRFLNVLNILP